MTEKLTRDLIEAARGNVIAALKLAGQLGPHATVVTVMCDTGMKYLSKVSSI